MYLLTKFYAYIMSGPKLPFYEKVFNQLIT